MEPLKSELELSVAICTRDRRESLLRSIASLTAPAEARWELLVIDNASCDDTRCACESLADAFPTLLRVVDEPTPGLSHARNRALSEARGRVVVFIDDDVTCQPGFVDAHARAFQASDVVASGGRILPVLPAELRGGWRRYLERELGGPTGHYDFGLEPRDISDTSGVLLPFGGNVGVVREAARSLGGFRPDLGFGGELVPGEETALLRRLGELGRIVYVPAASVDHHVGSARVRLAYWRRWQRGYGRARVRMERPTGGVKAVCAVLARGARAVLRALRQGDAFRALCSAERVSGELLELWSASRRA
jgi:glycosyltransferase involved in cell wall biosynthesis